MITTKPEQTQTKPATRQGTRRAPNLSMPDWGAAGWAALIAGTTFMVFELFLLPLSKGGNAWVPVRMAAAIIWGRQILPPPPYFVDAVPDTGIFFTALALHYSLALVYMHFLSTLIYKVDKKTAALAGAFFGLILYAANFYGFTGAFPWFAAARGWATVVSNVVFGVVGASCYKLLESEEPLDERRTFEERF